MATGWRAHDSKLENPLRIIETWDEDEIEETAVESVMGRISDVYRRRSHVECEACFEMPVEYWSIGRVRRNKKGPSV